MSFYEQGQLPQAAELYAEVVKIHTEALGPEHPQTARSLDTLADMLRTSGAYSQALPLQERVLELSEARFGPEHLSTATALNNLAELLFDMGQLQRARPLYERALRIHEAELGPEHPDTATLLNNLAELLRAMGDLAKARHLHSRALTVREATLGPDHPYTAMSQGNLAGVLRELGEFEQALPLLKKATSTHQIHLGAEHPYTAASMNKLASLLFRMGEYEEARPLYELALDGHRTLLGPEHPYTVTSMSNLAALLLASGDLATAEELLRDALEIGERTLGPEHPDTLMTMKDLSLLLHRKGDLAGSLELAIRMADGEEDVLRRNLAGSEQSRYYFVQTFRDSTDMVLSFHLLHDSNGEEVPHFALETWLRRKGRVLDVQAQTFATLRRGLDDEGVELLEQLVELRREESALIQSEPGEDIPGYVTRLEALDQQAQELEQQLAYKSQAFAQAAEPVTIEAVSAQIPDNGAVLEYAVFGAYDALSNQWGAPHLAAYTLAASGEVRGVDLGELAPIETQVERYRQTLSESDAAALYDTLIAPILPDPGAITHLFISPDGTLNLIPFEALQSPDGTRLIETVSLSYLSTGRDLLRLSIDEDYELSPPLVLADPDYRTEIVASNRGIGAENSVGTATSTATPAAAIGLASLPTDWAALPGTAKEAKAIAKTVPEAIILTGPYATADALRAVDSPRFLHVATHGFSVADDPNDPRDDNPMVRSGLVFAGANQGNGADTLLLASEVASLDLDGTRLVVLSACESGLGDAVNGEGVYGMRRALQLAGSRSQVMSLWPVDDAATMEFMTGFYERLEDGQGMSEALRETKLEMMRSEKYGETRYWAPFVLAGDWR
jgi:CHAT domain-containing protein/Tfp pilus assembly protein PilF